MSPHLHTHTDTYTQLKIELVFKNSPAIVSVLILLKLSVLLGDTDPGWSVCNWISFLNISSSLLGLANHLFILTVPAGATYYEFLFFSFSHLFLLWPNSLKKKSQEFQTSACLSEHFPSVPLTLCFPSMIWLLGYCSHFVFGGLDLRYRVAHPDDLKRWQCFSRKGCSFCMRSSELP